MKKIFVILITLLVFSSLSFSVSAKAMTAETIEITEVQSKNLYLSGETVTISADVEKDVIAAGERVIIAEGVTVGGNVFLAGQEVQIDGDVMGDIIAAGANVVISGMAGDDIRAAGSNVVINSENVAGDLVLAGNFVYTNADVVIGGEEMIFAGNTGDASSIESLTDLTDYGYNEQIEQITSLAGVFFVFGAFLFAIGGFILNYLILRVFPVFTTKVVETIEESQLNAFLYGIAVSIVVPIVGFLLLVSVVGMPILFFLAALFFVVYVLAEAVSTYYLGYFVLKTGAGRGYGRALNLLTGTILMLFVSFVPFLSGFASFVLVSLGLGAMAKIKYDSIRKLRKKK